MELIPVDYQLGIVVIILTLFSLYAFFKHKVNKEGIFLAVIIGLSVFRMGDFLMFLTLIIFFTIGTIATNLRESYKKKIHGVRTTKNILANMGLPTIFLLLGSPLLFFAGLSAALADTLSSEFGMLSRSKPRLITTFKTVEAGRNGAVSFLGLLAGLLGSLIIAVVASLALNTWEVVPIMVLAGMVGTLFDSLLGATLERKQLIDNSQVNTLATFAGSLTGMSLRFFGI